MTSTTNRAILLRNLKDGPSLEAEAPYPMHHQRKQSQLMDVLRTGNVVASIFAFAQNLRQIGRGFSFFYFGYYYFFTSQTPFRLERQPVPA